MHPIHERQAVPSPFPDPNQTVIRLTLKHHCRLTILTPLLCLIATLRFLTGSEVFRLVGDERDFEPGYWLASVVRRTREAPSIQPRLPIPP